ncbi:serine esterase [Mycolicibacterium insubricum]|jgi:cutinase|uniref:Cutinase n=1 Tax=Mycolicibacterium insubricum TaxID=444597 RepID=A0A1X0D6N6_9MYCO|nr:cutinase family protein [Mycolicibacterium insubricum]MCB9440297.1 cutinase family protein [Mycolicibacterium sp.]MCV7081571.1 cutinase family protein [Mycolicibacterium insubricum]ORA68017.1 cutinase family protein [Mycolicibacterium insubricum]BBZ66270.1 serine esterase [Mycolicibacterium insubricum]
MSVRHVVNPALVGGPAARRLSHLGAAALFLTAIPLVTTAAPPAAAEDCPVAEVVFARGTDEPAGMGRVGDAMVDSLREQTGGLDIRTYAVNYKATITQRHSGEGAKDAINHIKATVDSCPRTKIVLGGYSQGASVVNIVAGFNGVNWGDPLPRQYMDSVVAVATFGNVANRTGGPTNTQSSPLASKSIDLCNPADPICHEGSGNSWSGHTDGYVPVYTDKAAAYIASALLTHATPQYGLQLPSVPADGSPTGSGQAPGPQQPATVAAVPSQPGSTAPGLVVTGT